MRYGLWLIAIIVILSAAGFLLSGHVSKPMACCLRKDGTRKSAVEMMKDCPMNGGKK